jgi:hypothetical protein
LCGGGALPAKTSCRISRNAFFKLQIEVQAMSVAGILSSLGQLQLGGASAATKHSNLLKLGQDLDSNNLTTAQSEFAALQRALSAASPASNLSVGPGNPARLGGRVARPHTVSFLDGVNQLGQALASGNLSSAKRAYASLQLAPPDASVAGQLQAQSPVSMLA